MSRIWSLTTILAGRVSLQDFRGKVVLLHFWSVQCPACRIEEPLLEKLKQAFGPSGLEILGVNLVDHASSHFQSCRLQQDLLSHTV